MRINAIDGMAGVGKTAFAVHAAHQLASRFPDGQRFVRLHGHTSGRRPTQPSDALAALLLEDGLAPQQIPDGVDARAGVWRDRMADRKALLLLDDAIGTEQVLPLLPGTAGTLVLVTSRHRLTALAEALAITLDVLKADEAAQLLVRLAGRSDLLPSDDAVTDMVALCGYLPLAISLMAGQLKHHPIWTAADLAAELASAADRLSLMAAEHVSVTAAFNLSYGRLRGDQQRLFRRLSLYPGSDIDAYAAAALNDTSLVATRRLLDDLFGYHLINEPARGRYRFHDLIREHARTLAAKDPPAQRDAAAGRLLDYYLHAARAADQFLTRRTPAGVLAVAGLPPAHSLGLLTREDAVAWMDAERLNLHAAVDYAATCGWRSHVIAIPAAMHGSLRTEGHWDQALTLHHAALKAARHTEDQLAEAGALTDLGDTQQLTGDYPAATASLTQALELYRGLGNRLGEANTLSNLGSVQFLTGDSQAAAASLNQALELYRDLGNLPGEANAHNELGTVQYISGDYPAAATSFTYSLNLYSELSDRQGKGNALNRLGAVQLATGDYPAATVSLIQALELYGDHGSRLGKAGALNYLGIAQYLTGEYPAAIVSLTRALELYRDLGNRHGQANSLNELGVVQHLTGVYPAATESLTRALELYRDLGNRLGEANALNALGSVEYATRDFPAATASLTRALELYRDVGDQSGEAEVLNTMGEVSLACSAPAEAHAHHEQAHAIATGITSPLEEARALEGIGRCHFHQRQLEKGGEALRQALAIYQQIGSPRAQRVVTALHDHGL